MKYDAYKLISEVLANPSGSDMLVIKPSLYAYIPNDQLDSAKSTGIKADKDNFIAVYFSRIPETTDTYKAFLSENTPIKISLGKLKSIKDQKVSVHPVNIDSSEETLTDKELKDLCGKNGFFFKYFESGKDLNEIPHARIFVSSGVLPSFVYKILSLVNNVS